MKKDGDKRTRPNVVRAFMDCGFRMVKSPRWMGLEYTYFEFIKRGLALDILGTSPRMTMTRILYICHPGLDPGPIVYVTKPDQLHRLDPASRAICDKLGSEIGFNLSQNAPSAGRHWGSVTRVMVQAIYMNFSPWNLPPNAGPSTLQSRRPTRAHCLPRGW